MAAIAQKNVRSLAGIAARLREEAAALDDLAVAMAQQDSAISLPESLDQSQQATGSEPEPQAEPQTEAQQNDGQQKTTKKRRHMTTPPVRPRGPVVNPLYTMITGGRGVGGPFPGMPGANPGGQTFNAANIISLLGGGLAGQGNAAGANGTASPLGALGGLGALLGGGAGGLGGLAALLGGNGGGNTAGLGGLASMLGSVNGQAGPTRPGVGFAGQGNSASANGAASPLGALGGLGALLGGGAGGLGGLAALLGGNGGGNAAGLGSLASVLGSANGGANLNVNGLMQLVSRLSQEELPLNDLLKDPEKLKEVLEQVQAQAPDVAGQPEEMEEENMELDEEERKRRESFRLLSNFFTSLQQTPQSQPSGGQSGQPAAGADSQAGGGPAAGSPFTGPATQTGAGSGAYAPSSFSFSAARSIRTPTQADAEYLDALLKKWQVF